MTKFKKGDKVFWNDPDNNFSSGKYTVTKIINDELLLINSKYSEAEVFEHELTLLKRGVK